MTNQTTPTSSRRLPLAALLAAGALGLTACAGSGEPAPSSDAAAPATASSTAAPTAEGAPSSSAEAADATPLTVTDPWTKATDGEMTGSFGVLRNTTDEDVHVVAVTSSLTDRVELHEMVPDEDGQMLMRQSPDGFTVPAGGTLELAPGGSHVMLMGLTEPIRPGDEVSYTLETENGDVVEVTSVARPFTGANESYHGGEASGASGSMDGGHADH